MSTILQYNPGQVATVILETLNAAGVRADGYDLPQITRIIFPNLSLASGYPLDMTKLDQGLYMAQFTLPALASSVGTYIVDMVYFDPDTGLPKDTLVQILVNAPMGQYSATTF